MNSAAVGVTDTDIRLAKAYLSGGLDEEEFRKHITPGDTAIIEAYREITIDLRSQLAESQADLLEATGTITVLQRERDELKARAEL